MSNTLSIVLQSPLDVPELVATVDLVDGQQISILLIDGGFCGELPAPALRVRLTGLPASAADRKSSRPIATPTELQPYAVEELFEEGIAVPSSGALALALTWGVHCHRELYVLAERLAPDHHDPLAATTGSSRFGSFEHITCAQLVGMGDDGQPLVCNDIEARFDCQTPLGIGNKALRFGEILAIGGDYYAHFDQQAETEFAWAWPAPQGLTKVLDRDYRQPTLVDDTPQTVHDILKAVDDTKEAGQEKLDNKGEMLRLARTTRYPMRRYLALASQNFCHFASQPATGQIDDTVNDALRLYRAYHARAQQEAAAAQKSKNESALHRALAVDAFGCHFLSDLFATGHMRVQRRVLSERYGVLRGALGLAHKMHCEDNKTGLWLTTRLPSQPRVVWRGYGDDKLHKPEALHHFWQVRRAVARSAAEVFASYCGTTLPAGERAEDLIPVILPAGQTPRQGDILPDGKPAPQTHPNSYPLYWWLPEKNIMAHRVGGPDQDKYVNQDDRHSKPFSLP